MKIVIKNSGFENIGTVVSLPEGSHLDFQAEGGNFVNVGKVIEERSALADLKEAYPFLASTDNDELAKVANALSKLKPDNRLSELKQSPFWERWLQNGANGASIAALVTQLVSMVAR